MRILYLTTPEEDYLQDQILIGLREIFGTELVDHPKKDVMYQSSDVPKGQLYGHGFTVWKTLPDILIERSNIIERLIQNPSSFQLIVFGSIWRQLNQFYDFKNKKIFDNKDITFCFIDGQDHSRIFWPSLKFGKYYKRELRRPLTNLFVNKIGFSIPSIKIRTSTLNKTKMFATHVQCEEAYKIEEIKKHCKTSYAFRDEAAYYNDIAISRYAVTMKKGGWNCMRHYEIAANGTVPCFFQLSKKPKHCAPHGLVDMENVITFNSADELTEKISLVDGKGIYSALQVNALKWAQKNSCQKVAENLIHSLNL